MALKVGSDFSGVGALNQALIRLGIDYEEVFACEINKFARQTFIHNYGQPKYYPEDVYEREIPKDSLDLYVTSPPCFVGDTLILTNCGFKQIKDIAVGDYALTHKNKYEKIIDFGSKKAEIYELKAQGILPTKTTSNHRYYTRLMTRKWNVDFKKHERVFSEPEWVEVKDLTKNHFIGINIPNIEDNPFNITKETAYILGRYVADGCIRDRSNEAGLSKGNSVVLAIGKAKVDDIHKKIKIKFSLGNEIKGVRKLFIYSNKLVSLIKSLELGNGAINKRIPIDIINLPKNILQSFVCGYMDGDGHSQKDFFRATSVSKELLMGLQLCVAKLYRVNSNIILVKTPDTTVIEGRTVNQRDYYVLEFRKEMRKQSNAVVIDDVIWYPVRSVIKTNTEDTVYDITVENDHSFTANQAIVHNCQSFSLAGKRLGESDKRGILFYNSHEFIKKNKPRFFIFENVKGLLSDDAGKTFKRWIEYLGGKSVNGAPIIFPSEHSVPYHVYYKILNAKDFNVPQNRERIFIIGIRDDKDNYFSFPKEECLSKRLKDVLEDNVDEKYFLSETMVKGFERHRDRHSKKGNGFKFDPKSIDIEYSTAITTRNGNRATDLFLNVPKVIHQLSGGKWDKTHEQSCRVYDVDAISPTIHTMGGGNQEPKIGLKSNIRKLTPRECFRLMDFPDSFDFSCVSDSQAYKQAGNSIVVKMFELLLKKLKF